jgi:hypothetical protein
MESLRVENARLRDAITRIQQEARIQFKKQSTTAARERELREFREQLAGEIRETRRRLEELERARAGVMEELGRGEAVREQRVREAEARFRADGGPDSDRGRIYVEFGPPTSIESHPEANKEIWRYSEISGIGSDVEVRFEGNPLRRTSGPAPRKK